MFKQALQALLPRLSGVAVGFLATVVVLSPAHVVTLEAALAGLLAVGLDLAYSTRDRK